MRDRKTMEIKDYLSELFPFYDGLSEDEKRIMLSGAYLRRFKKGETVASNDASCLGAVAVLSGRLRVYMLSEEGREITLYYIEPSDVCVLSASCVISSITFEVHVEAEEDAEALQIASSVFGAITKNNLSAENFMLKQTAERFSDVMWAMQQLLFLSMDKRLAMFLYDESVKSGSDELNFTHEQIAKSLGTAREVVTRLLQRFVKEGSAELSRGKIIIRDRKALYKIFN